MKRYLTILLLIFGFSNNAFSQDTTLPNNFFTSEILVGQTMEANEGFPDRDLQTGIFLSYGFYNYNNNSEWLKQLNRPKTGISIGYSRLGNQEKLGNTYSILPFIEVNPFKKLHANFGLGLSYTDTKYDIIDNPLNKAITTNINWTFKSFLYYDLYEKSASNWRLGLGYIHHSNGHTQLPNQGLNSFLFSFSNQISFNKEPQIVDENPEKNRSSQYYFSTRTGVGINVLSRIFNDRKPVYTIAFEGGKIYNKTFKLGVGFYYRYYQHYYDYIKNDEALVMESYPVFKSNPFGYATNFGVCVTSELLLNHVGIEFDLGLNIYKPFYKVDWILNSGYDYVNPEGELVVINGELDWYYEIKRTVTSRLGLKLYLKNNDHSPKHNFYLGGHINANLGQADFTALSLGYVYRFKKKEAN